MTEFTDSVTAKRKGLDNTPSTTHVRNIEEMVKKLLDPLREAWAIECAHEQLGTPAIRVSSGYRGFQLNEAAGGTATSAHCFGLAADLVPMNGRLTEFKRFCRAWLTARNSPAFDQLISEDETAAGVPHWIHLGYKNRLGAQRRQLLSMYGGKYKPMTA